MNRGAGASKRSANRRPATGNWQPAMISQRCVPDPKDRGLCSRVVMDSSDSELQERLSDVTSHPH